MNRGKHHEKKGGFFKNSIIVDDDIKHNYIDVNEEVGQNKFGNEWNQGFERQSDGVIGAAKRTNKIGAQITGCKVNNDPDKHQSNITKFTFAHKTFFG